MICTKRKHAIINLRDTYLLYTRWEKKRFTVSDQFDETLIFYKP